jgi:hypothetical protein
MVTAMARILRLSKLKVSDDKDVPFTIRTSVLSQPASSSGQPVVMKVLLVDRSGKTVAQAEQTSMLVPPIGPDQWRALGEGAAYRVLIPLREQAIKMLPPPPPAALAVEQQPAIHVAPELIQHIPDSPKTIELADEQKQDVTVKVQEAVERGMPEDQPAK